MAPNPHGPRCSLALSTSGYRTCSENAALAAQFLDNALGGLRPSVADWGGGMSVCCTAGPIVR